MATISLTDIIFATLRIPGAAATTIRINGVSSFAEVLSRLMKQIPSSRRGIATVEVRNGSQGWSARRNVILARA